MFPDILQVEQVRILPVLVLPVDVSALYGILDGFQAAGRGLLMAVFGVDHPICIVP